MGPPPDNNPFISLYAEFEGSRPKNGDNNENGSPYWQMGPPTGRRGSRLGPKCVTVNCGDLKVHENHKKIVSFHGRI